MNKSKENNQGFSPNRRAKQRFLKNKPAVFGLIVIWGALAVAILGYLIAPDQSPDANEQMPTVALSEPGFEVMMLKVRKNTPVEEKGIVQKMLFGQPSAVKFIPVNRYFFRTDSVLAVLYAGENPYTNEAVDGQTVGYLLADVVDELSYEKKPTTDGQVVFWTNSSGEKFSIAIAELQSRIESDFIAEKKIWLGTDKYGRDMLSRLLLGVRVSLFTGLVAVFISLSIGILLGALAGYVGGKVDGLIMLLINTVWSIPTLLLVFAIVLALGRGVGIIFLAVGLTMWVDVARVVRGQVMAFRKIQFVEAAQSMGFSTLRILFKHILPNILGPVLVIAAANFATAILIEAGLSYLGFGIQPPTPSWGTMLNENYGYAIGGHPFLALVPAIAIMMLVLAFNLVGNGLRDAWSE